MFFVSLSANIDPDDYAWLVFKRTTKMRLTGYNQRHVLVLEKGDIFGVRRTRSNTYQLVKADAMHVLYRNIQSKTHDNILKNSVPYKGPTPTPEEVETGFVRRRKVATHPEPKRTPNKRVDDYYKPLTARIVERFSIDLGNYQWRKLRGEHLIRVETKKQGKVKGVLRAGDIVGLRYRSPARGGYIILDGNRRVHIGHETYTAIVQASRPLPDNQQRTGVVDLESGRKIEVEKVKTPVRRKPKIARPPVKEPPPVEKLYDLEGVEDEEVLRRVERRKRVARKIRDAVRKILDIPEQDTWVEDEQDEFEPEQEKSKVEQIVERPEPDEDLVDEDLGDDEEEDEEDDELDEEDGARVADEIEPGTVLRMLKGNKREFVVVEAGPMERNDKLYEYLLHDPEGDEDEPTLYRLRLNVNTTMGELKQNAEIVGEYQGDLKSLQDSVDYAQIKPVSFVK